MGYRVFGYWLLTLFALDELSTLFTLDGLSTLFTLDGLSTLFTLHELLTASLIYIQSCLQHSTTSEKSTDNLRNENE